MLIRQSEGALIRHNELLKESIEHINYILRQRSLINNLSLEQLRNELINQQEKLFLIRNQLDIDHNKLTINMSSLKDYQQQRNQFEQIKLKKQIDLHNIQHIQIDDVQRQLKLQKLQTSIEQQTRVRNEIQQLEQYLQPKTFHQQDELPEIHKTARQEHDLIKHQLLDIVNEIDEEIVEASERHFNKQNHTYNYPFHKSNDYRENNEND